MIEYLAKTRFAGSKNPPLIAEMHKTRFNGIKIQTSDEVSFKKDNKNMIDLLILESNSTILGFLLEKMLLNSVCNISAACCQILLWDAPF